MKTPARVVRCSILDDARFLNAMTTAEVDPLYQVKLLSALRSGQSLVIYPTKQLADRMLSRGPSTHPHIPLSIEQGQSQVGGGGQ